MLRFTKVSTLFETGYGILALLSTLVVTFSAARFLVQHYLERMGLAYGGLGGHSINALDCIVTLIFLLLISSTFFEYEDTWYAKLVYGGKLLVCFALCFVVTDGVAPALVGKRSALLSSKEAQETLNLFLLLGIPAAVFWFILSSHTTTVFNWHSFSEPTLERGVQKIDFEALRQEEGQGSGPKTEAAQPVGAKRNSREAKSPARTPKRIRIVETPQGFAPEKIRTAWIGVEFTLEPEYERPEKLGGITVYQVDATAALNALRPRSPRAAFWWQENAPDLFEPGGLLGFPVEACAVVLDGEVRAVVTDTNPEGFSSNASAQKPESGRTTSKTTAPSPESDLPDMRRYAPPHSPEESE